MALTMAMLTLKSEADQKLRESGSGVPRDLVVFPRIDQKTCLKSIYTANLTPLVVEPVIEGDECRTNVKEIEKLLSSPPTADRILCVLSTTSTFAPRVYDSVVEIAELCQKFNVAHVINSAYGLQCSRISSDIVQADKKGRVDVLISSTDKNFMVPVGGSILYAPAPKDKSQKVNIIQKINKFYPGRASGAPIMDLFITYLEMGEINFKELLRQRKENFNYLKEELEKVAEKVGERVLQTTKNNKISIAFTLTSLNDQVFTPNNIDATFFGSYLFHRRVSGVRVCVNSRGKAAKVGMSTF